MGKQSFNAKRGNLWKFDPKDLVLIGLDTDDNEDHELYDKRVFFPLDESTVRNIMKFGVKQSVTFRNNNGVPEVVDGRRRVLHAREANKRLEEIGDPPVFVPANLDYGDDNYFSSVSISLNEIRLNDDLMTKAEKAVKLLQRNGGDIEDVAMAFGVSSMTIRNWIKLPELANPVKDAIVDGKISASAASKLHGMPKKDQVAALNLSFKDNDANDGGDGENKKAKKVTAKDVEKQATGKVSPPTKKVLSRLVHDDDLAKNIEPEGLYWIKVIIGEHIPDKDCAMGQLLEKAGYKY